MRKFLKIIPVIALIMGLIFVPLKTRADFGDFSGDSDFGGSWGDSDWGGSWDDDDDYSYSGSSRSSSSSDAGLIIIIIVLIILIGPSLFRSGKKSNTSVNMPYNHPTSPSSLRSISSYSGVDPTFSPSEFREKLSNLYVRFQNQWQAKDINSLRPYLTDAMFSQMNRQLDRYRLNGETNIVDRISVLGVELIGWKQENGYDVMIAQLNTRIVDYVVNDRTGAVIRGSKTNEKFMTYEWTLIRTTGVTTSRSTGTTSQTCPHCGAHVDINHSTVCEYCLSVLTTDTFDWAVSNIKALSQLTK